MEEINLTFISNNWAGGSLPPNIVNNCEASDIQAHIQAHVDIHYSLLQWTLIISILEAAGSVLQEMHRWTGHGHWPYRLQDLPLAPNSTFTKCRVGLGSQGEKGGWGRPPRTFIQA